MIFLSLPVAIKDFGSHLEWKFNEIYCIKLKLVHYPIESLGYLIDEFENIFEIKRTTFQGKELFLMAQYSMSVQSQVFDLLTW